MKRRKFLKYLGIGTTAAATGASIAVAAPERLIVHAPPRHAMSMSMSDFKHQTVAMGFDIADALKPLRKLHIWGYQHERCVLCGVSREAVADLRANSYCAGDSLEQAFDEVNRRRTQALKKLS